MQLEIRPDPAEVGRARRWARSRLTRSGIEVDEPLAETLILLVSELVTNAVVHTGRPAVLRLSLQGAATVPAVGERVVGEAVATVRLEVVDGSARPPRPRCADGDETNGRGLALVDGLADRWGWTTEGAGKRIWCEVDRCSSVAAVATTCDAAPAAYGDLAFEAV
ncbi:ATP-binding protein [Streptomyces sp. Qhu-G9]|uniref:ATP-binding protein n=1 Tax=Streptomyces sp. Qhu-G9 TaxID=3452799 RepID=UPI0022AC4D77|nr:ATP-binding protein [Streptomyces aurantiacus]WAU86640.1 ATP-binding protein [Streptomyces aurantiacus]